MGSKGWSAKQCMGNYLQGTVEHNIPSVKHVEMSVHYDFL